MIQKGSAYYFWCNGQYTGPYTQQDARSAAERDLAPAFPYLSLYERNKQGVATPKSLQALVNEYGSVAQEIIVDMKAQQAYFDRDERVFIEAPCPMRSIEPKFHDEIQKWLDLLAGPNVEHLCRWISVLTALNRPASALFLIGAKATGKSLFAYGHAKIWTPNRPTSLEEGMGHFNDALMYCPLVFGDEMIPRDFRGYSRTQELRHFVQAESRPLSRKYVPNSTILGAVRVVVAANNEEVLATPEQLNTADIAAIAERFLFIPVANPKPVQDYLVEINPRDSGWVDQDKIAEHALWLRDELMDDTLRAPDRFMVRSEDDQIHRSLMVRSGTRAALCQWLVAFLLGPARFHHDGRSNKLVRRKSGELLVNVQGVQRCWNTYITSERCPSAAKLSQSISTFAEDSKGRPRLSTPTGDRYHYRIINIDNLIAWAELTGAADRAQIESSLQVEDD